MLCLFKFSYQIFLDVIVAHYGDLILHTGVRWLSAGMFYSATKSFFSNCGVSSGQKWFSSETKIFCWCLYLVFLTYPTSKLHERTKTELTVWRRLLPEKLTCPQLVKKFPAFTTARNLCISRSRSIRSIHTSQFFKIHFNIILPTTHGSSKWSFFLRYSHQNSLCLSTISLMCYIYRSS